MSKTIKIIDLLNKISNGEIPKKVKFKDNIYIYEKDSNDYAFIKNGYYHHWLLAEHMDILFLNKEVELIEDETIDINSIEEIKTEAIGDLANETKTIVNKILQWAKQTDKEIKSIKEK